MLLSPLLVLLQPTYALAIQSLRLAERAPKLFKGSRANINDPIACFLNELLGFII